MRRSKNTLKAKFIFNFPFGLLIGSWLALGFAMLIDEEVNAVILDHYVSTAIVAAATIFSASLAIWGVLWNIASQQDIVEDRRQRKLIAARASLPLALSEFIKLCENHIFHLANDTPKVSETSESLSEETQATLKLVVEHAEETVQSQIGNLLMFYQVVLARYFYSQSERKRQVETAAEGQLRLHYRACEIVMWESLRALISAQFYYARTEHDGYTQQDARQSFERALPHCRTEDGWSLTNDPVFRSYFQKAIENKESGFFKPNYFNN